MIDWGESRLAYIARHEELERKLVQVSGYDIEKLIRLFAAGYTLIPPEPQGSLEDMTKELKSEKTHIR